MKKLAEEVEALPPNGREVPKYPTSCAIAKALRINHKINVSYKTVQSDLAALNMKLYIRQKRPFFGKDEPHVIAKRLRFCRDVAQKTGRMSTALPFVRRIVFSDEHWCTINDRSMRWQWAACLQDVLAREVKNSKSVVRVQIWAAIGWNFKTPIIFIESKKDEETGKTKWMNHRMYINRCLARSGLIPHLQTSGAVFMQVFTALLPFF